MLDKSVPYAGIFMVRPAGTPFTPFQIPDRFSYALYRDGDERDWARIETSVLEFEGEFEALLYFNKKFKTYPEELPKRCLFIEND